MIQEFVDAWRDRKEYFREWLEGLEDEERQWGIDYKDLVEHLFIDVLNPCFGKYTDNYYWPTYDIEHIHVIDDGDYQGTLIFVIPEDIYQPDTDEYVYTSVYYGSCSYCDTLQCAQVCEKDKCIDQLMILALHLIENFKHM